VAGNAHAYGKAGFALGLYFSPMLERLAARVRVPCFLGPWSCRYFFQRAPRLPSASSSRGGLLLTGTAVVAIILVARWIDVCSLCRHMVPTPPAASVFGW
jgi:hypothetical protein